MKRIRTILAKIFSLLLLFGIGQIGNSNAYFSDTATVTGNTVTTGYWEEEESVPPQVVVINEVMWMGSTVNSHDEWIELRNITSQPVDIGQWTIENATSSHGVLHIPASKTIPANGYFLIANYPETSANSALNVGVDEVNASLSLANSGNGNLVLKDRDGNIIDQAKGDPDWPAGFSDGTSAGPHKSMERNDSPGDGLSAASWHTCINVACNDTTYWDAEGNNYGTPKAANLSENDSSLNLQEESQEQGAEQTSQDGEDEEIVEEDSSQPADPEPEEDSQESVLPEEPEVEQEAPILQEDLEVPPSPEPQIEETTGEIINEN